MENLKDKINVFGHDISLDLKGLIVTMEKISDSQVMIKKQSQALESAQYPVNVQEKYGKTSDEFISEFELNIIRATQN
jgi:hypothetical protein